MNFIRNFDILDFVRYVKYSYLPNRDDNFKQILTKVLFIISLIAFIVSGVYICGHFINAEREENTINASRQIWHKTAITQTIDDSISQEVITPEIRLIRKNPDFKGWLTVPNTKIDNPIYHTNNNDYYLTHNQNRQISVYGALYFDYRNTITKEFTDKNLVIYGHEMKNGSMFGELKKYRQLDFYKNNPTLQFSTLYSKDTYKIYAVFVLNASKNDDDGRIYNLMGQDFKTEDGFDSWVAEAKERSLINTNVDVKLGDDTITLVTCCNDFPNARLVVMARKLRDGEDPTVNTASATFNANPKYPKIWYEQRNIEYPFN